MRYLIKVSYNYIKPIAPIVFKVGAISFIIVFRLVRDVVANHRTTRYAGVAMKVIQKITLLKYNVGVQAALYAKER